MELTKAKVKKMVKADLARLCNARGLPVCRDMTRDDLVDMLLARMGYDEEE